MDCRTSTAIIDLAAYCTSLGIDPFLEELADFAGRLYYRAYYKAVVEGRHSQVITTVVEAASSHKVLDLACLRPTSYSAVVD